MKPNLKIMIVAGEASGDGHSAHLVEALRAERPETDFEFFGAAGPAMRAAGVEAVVKSDELSIVGVAEIARALPMFLSALAQLKSAALERKPDVVVLTDFPDFNLRLAKWLKRKGFTVVYYISPQLWAWRGYRISTIRKYVDLLLTILPFEQEWYAKRGVDHVEYVGNPLAASVTARRTREEFCRDHGLDPTRKIIAMLPGSRRGEIARIFPRMLETAGRLSMRMHETQFVIAVRSGSNKSDVNKLVNPMPRQPGSLIIVEDETYDTLAAADAALITSGTATLEAGIIGVPMVIVYATSNLNYRLLRPLISIENFGLVNLIAGERIATELLQHEFTPDRAANEIAEILEPDRNREVREQLRKIRQRLGTESASHKAAAAILRLLDSK
jgi:lipid-A-disaccharide synthase